MNKQQIRPFVTGAVVGSIALSILMFSTGWAVTGRTAEMTARQISHDAVVESLASICVAQFEQTEDKSNKLDRLIATTSWQRGSFVSDQGWATMPGSESPTSGVATECAIRLAKLSG